MASKAVKMKKFPGVYYRQSSVRKFGGVPDRCYYAVYRHNGKLIWEKVGWASEEYTPQDAAQIRADRIRAIRHGEALPQKKKFVSLSLDDVWESYIKKDMKESTRIMFKNRYNVNIKPVLGDKNILQIEKSDIEKLKRSMEAKGLAPDTVKGCISLVSIVFNYAIEHFGYKGANPAKMKITTKESSRLRFLTRDEAESLLTAAKERGDWWYEIILFALETGMRKSELLSLQYQHINLESGIINVVDTKGGKNRVAYITKRMHDILRKHKLTGKWNSTSYVFPGIYTKTKTHLGRFQDLVDKVGLNDGVKDRRMRVVFHTLRHTFASWLAQAGTPLNVIMELTGHSSLQMVQRYAHLIPDQKQEAVAKLFNK